ncbi:protein tyrosine phosphatase family protein [Roseibium sp. M-1]
MKAINAQISVAPQIRPEDIADFARQGFRAVICNRPDGEGADQPSFEEIEAAAKKLGLEARYLPVAAGKVGDEEVDAFAKLMETLPKPVLAYCRTGTRSATLWSLSQADKLPLADILARTKSAGYDMAGIIQRITDRGPSSSPSTAMDEASGGS